MDIVENEKQLRDKIDIVRTSGSVGFVPTMGALHKGHISLVEKAMTENDTVVVSIFVNPTQFNDPADLERYPRTLDADLEMLKPTGCQVVFIPSVKEIYPVPDKRLFDFGIAGEVMEGKHRPGHFNGVAQVVSRLFKLVNPQKAYFGLKDFQQLAIIKLMAKQLNLPVEIVPCPIIREESGLAMSSRNELLTPDERKNAATISQVLLKAKLVFRQKSVSDLIAWVIFEINKNPFLMVEYFEIVDSLTLNPVLNWDETCEKTGCIAVFCGKIRLIDNVVFN